MNTSRTALMFATAAALLVATAMALAQDAINAPAQKTIGEAKSKMVPSLAVLNSRGASLQNDTLTLTGVSPNSIVFADRPVRAAGHVLTSDFLKEWDAGSNSFATDPPNATISVLGADGGSVEDAVVVLKAPKLEGDKLTFQVSVLEGGLSKATGPLRCSSTGSPRADMAVGLSLAALASTALATAEVHGMALGMLIPA
jgi:hypothetical protein